MDLVNNFHGLSGHCPWKLSSQFLGFLPNILYRAMYSEGVLMFKVQCMSFHNASRYMSSKLIDIKS